MVSFLLDELTFVEVQQIIKDKPILIIPLVPMEPYGKNVPLGAINEISATISSKVASESNTLCATSMRYSFATPFKAFSGVLSMRKNTFITAIADVVRSAIGWGVKKVIFLDSSVYLQPSVEVALKRFQKKMPQDFTYEYICWQQIGSVRKIVKDSFDELEERWRSEALIACLYREICDVEIISEDTKLVDQSLFQRWKKRGMDPEKLIAYSSGCSLSRWKAYKDSGALLPQLVSEICKRIP